MKKNLLDDVHPDHNFWVVDGTTLKNMHELLSALEKMDDDTYKYHVNEEKNDFHNWVRDVHKDGKLAELLAETVDKEAAVTAIKRRIQEIQKPDRELGKGPLQNKDDHKQEKKVDTTFMMRMFDMPQKEGNSDGRKKNIYNKTNKVPFPKPVASYNLNHRKYEIIITIIAVVFIVSLMGVSSQAAQITGAVVGSPQTQEVQFLGLGGVFAVLVLLFAALHALEKHAKNEI